MKLHTNIKKLTVCCTCLNTIIKLPLAVEISCKLNMKKLLFSFHVLMLVINQLLLLLYAFFLIRQAKAGNRKSKG